MQINQTLKPNYIMADEKNKKGKKRPFATVNEEKKDYIMNKRNKPNTNKATKLWMNCFQEYLEEKNHPKVEDIEDSQLPSILENFYTEVRRKNLKENAQEDTMYSNTTLRAIRAALNRYFKEKKGIDITSNSAFIKANELFTGVQKINKEEGRGTIKHKEIITQADLVKLNIYFEQNMDGPPNPKLLQEYVLFNIIYYMGRRGRENLRSMTKNTFKIATDEEGQRYIFQAVDEADKNHNEVDNEASNQARIYEVQGEKNALFKPYKHGKFDDVMSQNTNSHQ